MQALKQEFWDRVLDALRERVSGDEFRAWIAPIQLEDLDEQSGSVILSVSSEFYQRWISRKYLAQIEDSLNQVQKNSWHPQVIVRGELDGDEEEALLGASTPAVDRPRGWATPPEDPDFTGLDGISSVRRARIATPPRVSAPTVDDMRPRLNVRYTFDDFVVGESNRYAHAAAHSVADPTSTAFNPLFLYGQSGLGKTHLMQAIGHEYLKRKPSALVLYVTSEQFVNSFIESIQNKRSFDFRNQYRNVDLLLLDDVQFLMGKERTQHEVFHTFNALFDAGKKIVLTSDRPPKDLATLEDRLRSRFEWGVIADIQPPDLETRIAILHKKARQEGLSLPTEVLTYIAEWVKSNIRELEGALKRIKVYASLHNRPITLEVTREVLSHLIVGQPQSRITIEDIQRAVCEYFEISASNLLGSNRSKKFSQPRHLALYMCRELTDLSFPDIAQKFGGKDHTSVIYACRKIKKAVSDDPNMASIVQYLTKQIQKGQSA
jgi:chromosomal replication initiator protein